MINHHVSTLFNTAEEFEAWIRNTMETLQGISDGTIAVPKSTSDGNGKNIAETYVERGEYTETFLDVLNIMNGTTVVPKANEANSATNDSNGDKICKRYTHNIKLFRTCGIVIESTQKSAYTVSGLAKLLYTRGFDHRTRSYPVSGLSARTAGGSSCSIIYGCYGDEYLGEYSLHLCCCSINLEEGVCKDIENTEPYTAQIDDYVDGN